MQMDDQQKQFFAVVDEFINFANSLVPKYGTPRVSSTLLFAASRFNAHNFYASEGNSDSRDEAIEYYCQQYRAMLTDNFDWLDSMKK